LYVIFFAKGGCSGRQKIVRALDEEVDVFLGKEIHTEFPTCDMSEVEMLYTIAPF
jgi:hypothetical protein